MSKKAEEYKQKLEKHRAVKAEKAKLFNPNDVLVDSSRVKRVYVEAIDRTVEYGPLTLADMEDITQAKTDQERAITMLWKMLAKADPDWTLEKVKQLPLTVATAILAEIAGPLTVPLTPKPSKTGSTQTPRSKHAA